MASDVKLLVGLILIFISGVITEACNITLLFLEDTSEHNMSGMAELAFANWSSAHNRTISVGTKYIHVYNYSDLQEVSMLSNGCLLGILDLTSGCAGKEIASYLQTPYIRVFHINCNGQNSGATEGEGMYLNAAKAVLNLYRRRSEDIWLFHDDSFSEDNVLRGISGGGPSLQMMKIHGNESTSNHSFRKFRRLIYVTDEILMLSTQTLSDLSRSTGVNKKLSDFQRKVVVSKDLEPYTCVGCSSSPHYIFLHHSVHRTGLYRRLQAHCLSNMWTASSMCRSMHAPLVYDATTVLLDHLVGLRHTQQVWTNGSQHSNMSSSYISGRKTNTSNQTLQGQYYGILGPLQITADGLSLYTSLQLSRVPKNATSGTCQTIGVWHLGKGFTSVNKTALPDVNKLVLRVVTTMNPPFTIKETINGVTKYKGYDVDLLDLLSKQMNFNYEITEPNPAVFGSEKADGSWSGLIGELHMGAADLAIGGITITTKRGTVVDFTIPHYEFAGMQMLMKQEVKNEEFFQFMKAFSPWVWLVVGGAMLVSSFLLHILDRFSPYSYRYKTNQGEITGKEFTLKESMWFIMQATVKKGEGKFPRAFSARVFVTGYFFFIFTMLPLYTANLTADLTVARLQVPLKSLDDLTKQSTYNYSTVKDTVGQEYFQNMAQIETNFHNIWRSMSMTVNTSAQTDKYAVWTYPLGNKFIHMLQSIERTGFLDTLQKGLEKVKTEKFVLIWEQPQIRYEISRDCTLAAVGDPFSVRPYGFALQKGSGLKNRMDTIILKQQQERVLEKLKRKWWNSTSSCQAEEKQAGYSLDRLKGTFVVALMGAVLGLLALGVEHYAATCDWFKVNDKTNTSRTTGKRTKDDEATQANTVLANNNTHVTVL